MSILNTNLETFDPLAEYFEGHSIIDEKVIESIPQYLVESMKVIRIPEGVTELRGASLFNGFEVEKIILPRSLKIIDSFTFGNLYSLEEINLEDCMTLEGIRRGVFKGCRALREVTLPEGIIYIDQEAFCACASLKYIKVPSTVLTISDSAFKRCLLLEKADLGACTELTYIPGRMFADCFRLKEVITPPNCTSLGNETFARCESLEEFIEPGIKSIGVSCFSQCTSLKIVELHQYVDLSYQAFNNCGDLTEVRFICLGGTPYGVFNGCYNLKEVAVQPYSTGIVQVPNMPWAHIKLIPRSMSTIENEMSV